MRRNRRPIAKRPEYTQVGIRVILSQRLTGIVVERRKEEENAMLRMCRAAEVVNHSASPTTEGPATNTTVEGTWPGWKTTSPTNVLLRCERPEMFIFDQCLLSLSHCCSGHMS